MSKGKDNLGCLRHLPYFGIARGDHTVGIRLQLRVGQSVLSRFQQCLRRLRRCLRGQKRLLRLIERGTRRHLRSKQTLLAIIGKLRLGLLRLSGLKIGGGHIQVGLLLFRIDARKQLARLHALPDLHQPLDDLAADAEGQIGLDTGADISGDCATLDQRLRLGDDNADLPWGWLSRSALIAA